MTDQQLLELAAKAAGLNIKAQSVNVDDRWIGLIVGEKHTREKKFWNPFTDDGDALRLAVKLGLKVSPYVFFSERCQLAASAVQSGGGMTEDIRGVFPAYSESFIQHDPYAATRRAITCAAAAIGETMGEQA